MMLLRGPVASGSSGLAVSHMYAYSNRALATTYTITGGAAVGAAAADRHLIICVRVRTLSTAPTSVTVGGSAATFLWTYATEYHFYSFALPTGTTLPDVVATWAAAAGWERALGVWVVTGADGSFTVDDSDTAVSSTVTVASGGIGIVAHIQLSTSPDLTGDFTFASSTDLGGGWKFWTGYTNTAGNASVAASGYQPIALALS